MPDATVTRTSGAPAGRPTLGGRIAVLDGLRIGVALFVAFYHYTASHEAPLAWEVRVQDAFPGIYKVTSYGWLGVEMFFIISGFAICMSSWGRSIGDFARSRIIRLFPAYWPAVLLTTAVVALIPTVMEHRPWNEVLTNLTMINRPLGVRPADLVYWTLWVEARFYLLFAVVLLWWAKGLTLKKATIFGYGWLLASVIVVNSPEELLKTLLIPNYSAFFVGGIALYLIHRFGADIKLWGLVGLSYALMMHFTARRVIQVGENDVRRELNIWIGMAIITIFYLVMIAVALGWTSRIRWSWLTTAGALTYPFYLTHEFIGWVIIHALRDVRPRMIVVVATIAIMMVVAYLLHRLIEKPLARLLKRKLSAAGANWDRPERFGREERKPPPAPAPPPDPPGPRDPFDADTTQLPVVRTGS
jgi:peptidoglycan/LPS O-acetylase OafA/YrhL